MAEDLDSFSDASSAELSDGGDLPAGSQKGRSTPKRMAEDKLHEKRLKERARRNGMAKSIDQMRLIVPELMDAKKVYSQAKVVAIALQHIYELQRENSDLRQRLGMKQREADPRPSKTKRGHASAASSAAAAQGGMKREAPAAESGDERAKKRRRVDEAPVALPPPTAPASSPSPAALAAAAVPKPPTAAALLALLPRALPPTSGAAAATVASSSPSAPAGSAPVGAPVQVREDGTLEALVVDSNSPSSYDDDEHMVSDTPLTLSPRQDGAEPDAPELFTGFSYNGSALWEEHDPSERAGNPHVSHDSTVVELMLQSVLNGTN